MENLPLRMASLTRSVSVSLSRVCVCVFTCVCVHVHPVTLLHTIS